ncbi:MAG: MBL fold metallo-hydrolase [Deltaproteobacteria bacterium]|nr:MAG: MBL fold metallo-hydrolase [Deltaproteobacteria bacterium]
MIPSAVRNPQNSFDIGEAVLVPYLKTKGVDSLDRLILSHPHPDHFGGAKSILENIPVSTLCGNSQIFPDESYDHLLEMQKQKNVAECVLKKGDSWDWEGLHWDVIYPDHVNPALNMNDNSLVLRMSDKSHSFLFTGDIEKVGEEILSDQPGFESEVMKIPHHGSKTSSSVAFIDTVKPKYAVASLGENNFFGFPHSDILERYQRREAQVFRTDQNGETCFSWGISGSPSFPNSTLSIQTFSSGK